MADMINPYANPYLPAFVNQRPRINDPQIIPQPQVPGMPKYVTIHPVRGFKGAREYVETLAPGSSEMIAEEDPNIPRIYIVACDPSGQKYVEGYRLMHEDEPKEITMDDLNTKMSELLERLNKLEEDKQHGKPESGNEHDVENAKPVHDEQSQSTGWNRKNVRESNGNVSTNARK